MASDPNDTKEEFLSLMALHKYFLNADFLRDTFMRRLEEQRGRGHASPEDLGSVEQLDNVIAMTLWYATLYVVIEGWRSLGRSDAPLDAYLADPLVDSLRVFRNQVFHYQPDYDNPRLLRFLGRGDSDAAIATEWIVRTHRSLGAAIESALQGLPGQEAK